MGTAATPVIAASGLSTASGQSALGNAIPFKAVPSRPTHRSSTSSGLRGGAAADPVSPRCAYRSEAMQ